MALGIFDVSFVAQIFVLLLKIISQSCLVWLYFGSFCLMSPVESNIYTFFSCKSSKNLSTLSLKNVHLIMFFEYELSTT